MRLLVAETPQRRHLGISSQSSVFAHDGGRIRRGNKEQVEWEQSELAGSNLLCAPVKSNVPKGWWKNIAQPYVPMIHGIGTRPPWVSSSYPPCPLIILSTEPRRSNWGPPSPRPSIGELSGFKIDDAAIAVNDNCWILSPFVFSIVNVSGSGATCTVTLPAFTVCVCQSPRSVATGAPHEACTSGSVHRNCAGLAILDGKHAQTQSMRTHGGNLDLPLWVSLRRNRIREQAFRR